MTFELINNRLNLFSKYLVEKIDYGISFPFIQIDLGSFGSDFSPQKLFEIYKQTGLMYMKSEFKEADDYAFPTYDKWLFNKQEYELVIDFTSL